MEVGPSKLDKLTLLGSNFSFVKCINREAGCLNWTQLNKQVCLVEEKFATAGEAVFFWGFLLERLSSFSVSSCTLFS